MKKLVLALLAISTIAFSCQARTSELVGKGEGYGPYNGWVVADMSMNDGVVSEVAAYSMRTFKDYGLVPVAYCASGGSHLGTYYLFYVNPYHDAVIIGGKLVWLLMLIHLLRNRNHLIKLVSLFIIQICKLTKIYIEK